MAQDQRRPVAPEWVAAVSRVADHVRANLTADLTLHELAATAAVSPFHFHRLFTGVMGETPAAYVRRARLERATKLMTASPHRRLSDIAGEVGLSGPSELSRSFRREHDIAPSTLRPGARRWAAEHTIPPPADRSADARPVTLAARRLAVVRCRGVIGMHDLSAEYGRLVAWAATSGLPARWQLIGMSWDDHETTPLHRVHYDFGAVIGDAVAVEPPLRTVDLPAIAGVAVRCDGSLSQIADAWDYLYRDWLPRTGRRPANLPAMKLFRTRPDQTGWSDWHVDCLIPLAPASAW